MKKTLRNIIALVLVAMTVMGTTVTSAFAAEPTTFNDVSDKMWYAPAVAYCADNGYMSGTGNNKFDPNGKVSRAQMAQILYNFAGRPDMTNAENPFTDVKRDAWYGSAVLFAKTTGIVNGTSSTTYSPNNYITREQVAVMLFGYYKASTGNTPSVNKSVLDSYTDKNMISSWAQDAIAWAIQNKIMSGTGNNKLDPKGTCTRAQLAQFIMNYCKAFGTPPPILPDIPVDDIVKELIGDTKPLPKDWLPKGGYIQGGRKYNMYGIDVTDVDGIPDREEARLINMINDYREENGLPRLPWNQHAQMLAEVRAREAAYRYEHKRPDGTNTKICDYTNNENGRKYLQTSNVLMFEELNATESMVDPDMVASNKKIDMAKEESRPWFDENLNKGTINQLDNLATRTFNSWKNSSGHNSTMLDDMTRWGRNGYAATALYVDKTNNFYIGGYNAYGIDWIEDYLVDPDKDWVPGRGIDYNALGFTLDDIPAEYPDWILRDPDMDLESYGPTDHDINSVTHWLIDRGVTEDSDTMYQVKAHYFSTLSMDDYIKFMFSNTEVFHYKNLMPGEWSDITEMIDTDISYMKEILVTNVADKMAYQHMSENNHSDTKCDVCGKNHAEKRDLAAAEQVVNQFFQDTYSFDISAY